MRCGCFIQDGLSLMNSALSASRSRSAGEAYCNSKRGGAGFAGPDASAWARCVCVCVCAVQTQEVHPLFHADVSQNVFR